MTRLRLTISQLMAVVLCVGIGVAALVNANDFWRSATYTFAITMLSAALVGAMPRHKRGRMLWTGFAVFGCAYLLVDLLPPLPITRFGSTSPRPLLLMNWGLLGFRSYLNTSGLIPLAHEIAYEQICYSLGLILFGLVGAVWGSLLATEDDQPSRSN
jgi:hypothetical protein